MGSYSTFIVVCISSVHGRTFAFARARKTRYHDVVCINFVCLRKWFQVWKPKYKRRPKICTGFNVRDRCMSISLKNAISHFPIVRYLNKWVVCLYVRRNAHVVNMRCCFNNVYDENACVRARTLFSKKWPVSISVRPAKFGIAWSLCKSKRHRR